MRSTPSVQTTVAGRMTRIRVVAVSESPTIRNHAAFIWSVADLLRGDYKQSEYGKVILPLVVLRRLDCVLEPTKDAVLARHEALEGQRIENVEPVLASGRGRAVLQHLAARPSEAARRPGEHRRQPARLHRRASRPARATSSRSSTSTSRSTGSTGRSSSTSSSRSSPRSTCTRTPSRNLEMGYLFEELIRRFSELSNETAGEHFTPREVIRLMVEPPLHRGRRRAREAGHRADALRPGLRHRRDALRRRGSPARAEPRRAARGLRPGAERRDLRHLPLRHDAQGPGRLAHRLRQLASPRTATRAQRFDYLLANPPFGVEWKKVERRDQGRGARSSASPAASAPGLPRDQRRLVPVPPAHDLEDEAGSRRAARGSPSSSTARRCSPAARARASRDPPLDHRERLARGHRRPARPALLQHRHLDLLLDRHQPQAARAAGQGAARRRPRVLHEDAQEPRREAQGDQRRADRRDHPPLRRVRGERAGRRSSATSSSASSGSPSSARSASATRSTTRRAGLLASSKAYAKLAEAEPGAPHERPDGARRPLDDRPQGGARRVHTRARQPRQGRSRRRSSTPSPSATPTRPSSRRRASRNPTPTCATTRTSRFPRRRSATRPTRPTGSPQPSTGRPSRSTSTPRCCRTSPTPGSTTPRRRSATRSRSPGTSTATCRRGRSRRSTPRSRALEARSRPLARSRSDATSGITPLERAWPSDRA